MADETPEPTPPKKSKRAKEKEALPFSEDSDQLDGRAWNRKPLVVLGVLVLVAAVVVAIVLAGNDLTSDGDDGDGGSDVPPPIQTTTTTAAPTTTTSTTTSTTTPTTTTAGGLVAGMVCTPIPEIPDCIDPEGDGQYNLIAGGAECLETAAEPLACADNDGDGDAGPAAVPT
jgi:hypothetical protein